MGWAREKYTREYFLKRDAEGRKLPYGADGVEEWEQGGIYKPSKRLLDQLQLTGGTILDIGCGRGEAARFCLQQGARHVTALDFSEAAVDLARGTLQVFDSSRYSVVCEDILLFLQGSERVYTHVLMLDVIEHIPRAEVEALLPELRRRLEPGGSLVVHTPFYPEDDDVLSSGGKEQCRDTSDDFEETKGMHINRYSSAGLAEQLGRHGFLRWGPHVFFRQASRFPALAYRGPGRRFLARLFGYRLR